MKGLIEYWFTGHDGKGTERATKQRPPHGVLCDQCLECIACQTDPHCESTGDRHVWWQFGLVDGTVMESNMGECHYFERVA